MIAVVLFWIAIAVIFYTYLGYPTWLYLRSRIAPRRWQRAQITPRISIVMAVHNGEALLRDKIEHLLTLDYPQDLVEIVIVSDGSTDGTNGILTATTNARLRAVVLKEQVGKAAALNEALRIATGELLVFVDLRPVPERGAVRRIVENFADPTIGCAGGEFCLRTETTNGTTAAVGDFYWRFEQWMRFCGTASDSSTSVAGCFYAVRRSLVGEFPPGLILDDMYQPLRVVSQGFRSVIDGNARVWDTLPKKTAGEFRRKVRTLAGNLQLLQMAPWTLSRSNRLRWQLVSHKLLRLMIPVCLAVVFAASVVLRHKQFYGAALVLQSVFYAIALLGLSKISLIRRVAGPASAFVVLNAAAAIGCWKFLFQRRSLLNIWKAPDSSHQQVSDSVPAAGSDAVTARVCVASATSQREVR